MDALPEVIRRYVLAVAESTQTPVDMAAVAALGIVSLCCQGKYFIRGNADWAELLNTYMVVIMEPAERKSSVLSMMIRPVEEYEKEENSRRNAEIVESRMIQDKLEKEKRSLVERASKGKATEKEVRAKAAELAKFEPAKPLRLYRGCKTVESLQPVLDRLCEYGYLAVKPVPPAYGPGRKPSDTYLVNPAVRESADGEGRS